MKENTDLTLKIIRHVASDEVGFPANLRPSDFEELFPEESAEDILYSLYCAYRAGLLEGAGNIGEHVLLSGEVRLRVGTVIRVTHEGEEYLLRSRTLYQKFVEKLKEDGSEISTELLKGLILKDGRTYIEKLFGFMFH